MAMAAVIVANGLANVSMISKQSPPSYDTGGISNARGVYQTGNIAEAHVPIPSGKIPVELNGGSSPKVVINNYIEGNTFHDEEKQAQVFIQLAKAVAFQVTPQAYAADYKKDGITRQIARGWS